MSNILAEVRPRSLVGLHGIGSEALCFAEFASSGDTVSAAHHSRGLLIPALECRFKGKVSLLDRGKGYFLCFWQLTIDGLHPPKDIPEKTLSSLNG